MNAEDPQRLRLYLARHEGEVVAATTLVTVGDHAWYPMALPRPPVETSGPPTQSNGA